MKNEAIIQKLRELGWNNESEITLIIHLDKYSLTEYSRYSGEWEGNRFVTHSQTEWKHSILESLTHGEGLISLLEAEDLNEMSSDSFLQLYLIEANDGNMDCLDTQWENPLSDEDEERLADSEDTVLSLADNEEHEPVFTNGSIYKMVIRVGNDEIDLYR
jgi:hypothetical protein